LIKISGTIERIPSQDLRQAEGMSAFFIVPARAKNSMMNIFADTRRSRSASRRSRARGATAGNVSLVGLFDALLDGGR